MFTILVEHLHKRFYYRLVRALHHPCNRFAILDKRKDVAVKTALDISKQQQINFLGRRIALVFGCLFGILFFLAECPVYITLPKTTVCQFLLQSFLAVKFGLIFQQIINDFTGCMALYLLTQMAEIGINARGCGVVVIILVCLRSIGCYQIVTARYVNRFICHCLILLIPEGTLPLL